MRKVAKEWVEEANNNNLAKMLQESIVPIVEFDKTGNRQEEAPTDTNEEDEAWQALVDSKISLSLSALLKLVPRFIEKVAQIISKNVFAEVAVNFTNPIKGLTIMNKQSPTIKVIIKGQEVLGSIFDGGSSVNVINKLTCDQLGIKWETCPFWLRMADTSTVRPLGLIRQLDVIIGGHIFQISTIVLKLEAQGAYPLLLGRP